MRQTESSPQESAALITTFRLAIPIGVNSIQSLPAKQTSCCKGRGLSSPSWCFYIFGLCRLHTSSPTLPRKWLRGTILTSANHLMLSPDSIGIVCNDRRIAHLIIWAPLSFPSDTAERCELERSVREIEQHRFNAARLFIVHFAMSKPQADNLLFADRPVCYIPRVSVIYRCLYTVQA